MPMTERASAWILLPSSISIAILFHNLLLVLSQASLLYLLWQQQQHERRLINFCGRSFPNSRVSLSLSLSSRLQQQKLLPAIQFMPSLKWEKYNNEISRLATRKSCCLFWLASCWNLNTGNSFAQIVTFSNVYSVYIGSISWSCQFQRFNSIQKEAPPIVPLRLSLTPTYFARLCRVLQESSPARALLIGGHKFCLCCQFSEVRNRFTSWNRVLLFRQLSLSLSLVRFVIWNHQRQRRGFALEICRKQAFLQSQQQEVKLVTFGSRKELLSWV